tara:strand:+ start:154 stop:330 length:177 start_codon:yes stop_codon:yes gene_type:complete
MKMLCDEICNDSKWCICEDVQLRGYMIEHELDDLSKKDQKKYIFKLEEEIRKIKLKYF